MPDPQDPRLLATQTYIDTTKFYITTSAGLVTAGLVLGKDFLTGASTLVRFAVGVSWILLLFSAIGGLSLLGSFAKFLRTMKEGEIWNPTQYRGWFLLQGWGFLLGILSLIVAAGAAVFTPTTTSASAPPTGPIYQYTQNNFYEVPKAASNTSAQPELNEGIKTKPLPGTKDCAPDKVGK